FDKITTVSNTKFDNVFAKIHTMDTNTPVQNIRIKQNAEFINADIYNIVFEVRKDIFDANVVVRGTKFYCDSLNFSPAALNIVNAVSVVIEDSKFIDRVGGIIVDNSGLPIQGKASGRIANNTVSFNADVASKGTKAAKRVGIEISNANIDIEDNEIEGGDEGIVMKTSSSGRISNNTVNFTADVASKKGIYDKTAIIVSDNSDATEITGNSIINNDSENENVTGIEINGSKADINYNTLLFEGWEEQTVLSRIGIKLVNMTDTLRIYNNTIYNTLQAFNNSTGALPMPVDIINNIFWSDQGTYTTINDTTGVIFYNNCFIDSTNITGNGNIFVDPVINSSWNNDFTLVSTSPCINAGMIIDGVHSFSAGKTVYYYGTAPDIGAKEFYQELTAPANVTTTVTSTDFTFGWDAVPGFNEYIVYSSNDPYGSFTVETITTSLSYTASVGTKKFYYVVASTGSKSYLYDNTVVTEKTQTNGKETAVTKTDKRNGLRINKKANR
ncbi:MAG: hypothetical protein KKD38_03730, partial [Candidatus Delongbacteria bacterium]|nr:hypothetical protein [Candidatus Delongbacteria bacterium]